MSQKNRILNIDVALVPPRWGLLRITTEAGIYGFGEFTVEGQIESAKAIVGELSRFCVGENAYDINRLWRRCYDTSFYHGGAHFMSALGGIEIALWDIYGKALKQPIYALLGGAVRDRVKVYRWAGGNNNSPEETAKEALEVVRQGAKAIKMNACPPLAAIDTYDGVQAAVARMRAVREAIGYEVEVALDFHGRANVPMARRLVAELEPFKPLFFEEPVRPEFNAWLGEVTALTSIPIATGERMTTLAEFGELAARRSAHIFQPDVVHIGGIQNTAAVAKLAEANGIALAPHCPLSPIAFLACLHVVVSSTAGWILEWSKGIHYNRSGAKAGIDPWLRYVDEAQWPMFEVDSDGHLALPTGPGLGVEFNWEEVEAAAKEGVAWLDQEMNLADGTRANW